MSCRTCTIIFLASGLIFQLFADPARDVRGDISVNYWNRFGEVELFLEKTRFRSGEEIPVHFRIKNKGYQIIRVYPSLEPGKSYQFMVTDRQGHEQQLRFNEVSYSRRENGENRIVDLNGNAVKEIILHPGETLEKTIYLNDFYNLTPGLEYRITGYYYPDARFNFFVRSANISQIMIDRNSEERYLDRTPALTESALSVSPEETIYLFLSAELQRNWDNYIKYINLRKYIRSYDRYAARFARASDQEKPAILREFSTYLTRQEGDLLKRFRIQRLEKERDSSGEVLENGRAYVIVQAERESRGNQVHYEYTYTLEADREGSAGFWKIIDVSARIMQ